ncbi:dolichyldiphosphatase [Strigomonas culicis]|nr:dolichyldiphosphatase [Strigomonas culicis]EPY28258.1 dolichyldiphosphatase [Strigomonas culicis]|eukprot:EPY23485.1 dolichyldiphosphatase [Strigomonas culicis]
MFSTADVVAQLVSYAHLAARCTLDPSAAQCGREGWSSWALTEVTYRRDHPLSFLFGVSSFLPLVVVMFLSGLASAPSPRRMPALALLMFLVVNVGLNVTLKRVLQSPRPQHPLAAHTTTHGMPSDHAQFMSFFVVYLVCGDYRRRRGRIEQLFKQAAPPPVTPPVTAVATPLTRKEPKPISSPFRKKEKRDEADEQGKAKGQRQDGAQGEGAAAAAEPSVKEPVSVVLYLFFITALLTVCWGRVYNGYHTVGQVVVGMVAGSVLAVLCATVPAQRAMLFFVEHVVVEVMFACTSWTDLIV